MDMKAETPAKGIMINEKWKDAHSYTVRCECGSTNHNVDAWVEVDTDTSTRDMTMTFFMETYTPGISGLFSRLSNAARILFTGYIKQEHSLILREQAANNFLKAVQNSVKTLKTVREE